jgi:hypothetical protein
VRRAPAAKAAKAAPNWWQAKIQPKTMAACSRPKMVPLRAMVGGTVATQSRP